METSIRGFSFTNSKTNSYSDGSISSSSEGELIMVNGDQEVFFFSIFLRKEIYRYIHLFIFCHLNHYHEAYCAITSNPDEDRKCICLKRFIIVLCERGATKLGGSETNNSGLSEPPLSELFKAAKKLKKTKTNGPSEPPFENKSMKIVASKKKKSRDCGDTIRVWDEPLSNRVEVKPVNRVQVEPIKRVQVEPQTERARVEPQTDIGSRKKAQTKKEANKPTQKEKELKEKKGKNNDQVGEPTKPTNKRAKPSDLPKEELDVLPVVYDSDSEIVIIEEVGQTENRAQTGSGH
ncbi:hypothetical protein GIB67_021480 [Kingdonia uniflora]|uniref:NUP160 middle TPR domain-containing protein n=1 Tax=Kingdonia uniflora TaxID=39325 RepID=A0A7J7L9P9_9MAGN|nr:hypothetical protein GIB67_021480 [Kingdonia uniflora]